MSKTTLVIHLFLSIVLIVGAYQFYFLCQRRPLRPAHQYRSALDEKIPYWPVWAWVYSFLYYPAILYLNLLMNSSTEFVLTAANFIALLFMQMAFFWLFPVATPTHWRALNRGRSWSEKFLLFVRKFDAESNCMPSMHTSVAMLCALYAYPHIGPLAWLFPLLIAISCLFTKQHYVVDLPLGALLGWFAYAAFHSF